MKRLLLLLILPLLLAGCVKPAPLPPSAPDLNSPFGVDTNINMDTIDDYLGRADVCYRDVRMLFDPADFGAIGGEADLTRTIEGFKVVPYPYLATLPNLPVAGAYGGPALYTLSWDENGAIAAATANYLESELILMELFPKDSAIFLMCGGGGYAGMLRSLLIFLDWDENLLYNIGANWEYTGANRQELVIYPEDAAGDIIYATWRANYAYIDFARLNQVER